MGNSISERANPAERTRQTGQSSDDGCAYTSANGEICRSKLEVQASRQQGNKMLLTMKLAG